MARTNRPTFASQLLQLIAPHRFGRYLCCILIGLPCWYVIGFVILFSPEFARALGSHGAHRGRDRGGRQLRRHFRRRSLLRTAQPAAPLPQKSPLALPSSDRRLRPSLFFLPHPTPVKFISSCSSSASAVGYWAVFVTVAAEHFGTNMRATVTTTVPNFAAALSFRSRCFTLSSNRSSGCCRAGWRWAGCALALGFLGLFGLRETFHDDLDYLEK